MFTFANVLTKVISATFSQTIISVTSITGKLVLIKKEDPCTEKLFVRENISYGSNTTGFCHFKNVEFTQVSNINRTGVRSTFTLLQVIKNLHINLYDEIAFYFAR